MKLPPIKSENGKAEPFVEVAFDTGLVRIELTTDGAGSYIKLSTTHDPVAFDPDEFLALAAWAKEACDELDRHNGEAGHGPCGGIQ
jgi:hypothetical protein